MKALILLATALAGACAGLALAAAKQRAQRLRVQPLRVQRHWAQRLWQVMGPWAGALRRPRRSIPAKRLEPELPAFLQLLIAGLRSGFSLVQALTMAVREGPPLLAAEVQLAIQAVNMGVSLEAALMEMAERVGDEDLHLLVAAVLISREAGGNLSNTLEALLQTVVERGRLRRNLRVLTAQGRLSATIVALLPFILVLLISVVNPQYLRPLFTAGPGRLLVTAALTCEGFGIWMLRRMVHAGEGSLS